MLLALALGGCSMSLGMLGGGGDDEPQTTGSIQPSMAAPTASVSSAPLPPPVGSISTADAGSPAATNGVTLNSSDWNYARGALGLALMGTESGPPVPWANPETGTRGAFAPKSAAVTTGNQTCREFTAHQVEEGREVELSGRACKDADGQWKIADLRPTSAAL